jgi:hypothetical protein
LKQKKSPVERVGKLALRGYTGNTMVQLYQKTAPYDAKWPHKWLLFRVIGNAEWLTAGLPIPTLLIPLRNYYYIGYAIEGFFGTARNRKFLQDIIARIMATLMHEGAQKVEYVEHKPYIPDSDIAHFYPERIYNLRDDLSPSLISVRDFEDDKERDKVYALFSAFGANTEDLLFDAIRFAVYDFVRANGKSALTYEYVEEIARIKYEIIGSKKGWSTAKAKAKAIYRWVMENYNPGSGKNNWNYKRKMSEEELAMTRAERARANARKREEESRKKVLNAVTGLVADELKKKNGKWSYAKIARFTGLDPDTVRKHMKKLIEEGVIH